MTDRLRAVLDTNVYVSAFLSRNPASPTRELIERWKGNEYGLLISDALADELIEKLLEKNVPLHEVLEFVALLRQLAEWIEVPRGSVRPLIAADPDDDHVIACAVTGHADCIVTYDPHFEVLGASFEGIEIMKSSSPPVPRTPTLLPSAGGSPATPFSTGPNLTTEKANYDGNFPYAGNPKGVYREKTVPVRSFDPNPWGLYEVHGNVWEWVWDWFGEYPSESVRDPAGPERGSARVVRGGSWISNARLCRSAFRHGHAPGYRVHYLGFRLVRTA